MLIKLMIKEKKNFVRSFRFEIRLDITPLIIKYDCGKARQQK